MPNAILRTHCPKTRTEVGYGRQFSVKVSRGFRLSLAANRAVVTNLQIQL
jgi:hypothetical protein